MALNVLKQNDLDLKLCLETFKISPFSLETFLISREEFIKNKLKAFEGNYQGIMGKIIRELFLETLRQAFTIFDDKSSEKKLFKFINKFLLEIILILRKILHQNSTPPNRPELTQFWHSTILTGEALKPFCADFSVALDDIFISQMFKIIKEGMDERLKDVKMMVDNECFNDSNGKYDLNTTIVLNCVVDVVNQVRLCPESEILIEKVKIEIENRIEISENIKNWAKQQI